MTTPSELSYREISLSNGRVTKVDPADYERLSQWKWYAQRVPSMQAFYAARHTLKSEGRKTILMHREILGLHIGDGLHGDHINGDTLDNRRINLRVATTSENGMNCKRSKRNKSGYKGVHWDKAKKKWMAYIQVRGRHTFLGYFETAEEAHVVRCKAETETYGEFARTE